jgi:hypothetical protein
MRYADIVVEERKPIQFGSIFFGQLRRVFEHSSGYQTNILHKDGFLVYSLAFQVY